MKIKYLDEWTEKRRANADFYRELKEVVKVPIEKEYEKSVYHTFIIRAEHRDELKEFLAGKGIGTKIHYPIPIHLQEAARTLGYKNGDFPEAEKQANEILSSPVYPELTDEQLNFVDSQINAFYGN